MIRVLGHTIAVVYDPNLCRDQGKYGSYQGVAEKILIDSSMSASQIRTTLLHEILEALNDLLHLELPHEKLQQIEVGLFAVMEDNPGIFNSIGGVQHDDGQRGISGGYGYSGL